MDANKPQHKPKVCSVLLPIYAASDYQSKDAFKGYDKITVFQGNHGRLPKWPISDERIAKFRG